MADLLYYMQPLPAAGRTGELQLKFRFKLPEKKNYKTESIKYKKMGAERQFGCFFFVYLLNQN